MEVVQRVVGPGLHNLFISHESLPAISQLVTLRKVTVRIEDECLDVKMLRHLPHLHTLRIWSNYASYGGRKLLEVLGLAQLTQLQSLCLEDAMPGCSELPLGLTHLSFPSSTTSKPCSMLPMVLQAYAGQLASFETSLWCFDHNPSLLSALPCLQQDLHILKLDFGDYFDHRNAVSWQPTFEQLQILDFQLQSSYFYPNSQCTWDLSCLDLAELSITAIMVNNQVDLRAIMHVRTASLNISFEKPRSGSWQEGHCLACCWDWKAAVADIRAVSYCRPPALDDFPVCVTDLVGSLVVSNACRKLRVHGQVMKLAE